MMRLFWVAGFALAFALPFAAHAQTAAEKNACRADVFRLCTAGQIALAVVGDRSGIFACLRDHRRELSEPCDRVMRSHGY